MEINLKPTRMTTSFKTEKIYPQLEELSLTPSLEDQVIEGAFNKVVLKGDADLIPENIKEGVNIFNVEGIASSGIDTSDATATEEDVRMGKTFYANGRKLVGTYVPLYTRLEYLESSDGKQYIDTGVQALSTVGAELRVLTPSADECCFFGAWGSSNGLLFGQAGSHWFGDECYSVATDSAWKNAPGIEFDASWHTYKYDATTRKSTIDGVDTNAPANSGRNANIYIFKTNNYGKCLAGTRISSCKLYKSGVLIRDYIPVRREADGLITMYDLIEQKFAMPSGEGSFIAGPEI